MKPLEINFTLFGFRFHQIARTGNIGLYRVNKGELNEFYEVFRIVQNKEYVIHGQKVEAHETVPNTTRWGKDGFTYRDQERAWERFNKMTATENPELQLK